MESVKSINKSASSSGHTTEQKPVYDFLNGFLTSYARRRAMEICYIKNRSVCFDLKIILKTITSVFKGEGAV